MENDNMTDFYDQVTQQQLIGDSDPYRYGSYAVYKANKDSHDFEITSYINSTSSFTAAYFPQFMYESVLKSASDNTDFTFTTVNAPLPVFDVFTQRQDAGGALDFAFMVSLAFAMIPTTMIAFILNERELQLKHI